MATIRLYSKDGRHCDVPEDHEWFAEYRRAYPLNEPPAPPKPATKPAVKKASRNG